MPPQRFASVRYKDKPAPRIPFRDDTSLVAFRYESTIQAEPPIPIPPPRNPLRITRPYSSAPTSPLVVVPPPIIPQEQHPALRSLNRKPFADDEEAKRDSGVAPTSSSVTIREECQGELLYSKTSLEVTIPGTPSVYTGDGRSVAPSSGRSTPDEPPRVSQSRWSLSDSDLETTPSSGARRLVKGLSFRASSPMRRLRKKSLTEDAPVPPQSRGSSKPKSPPKSPKFTTRAAANHPSLRWLPSPTPSRLSADSQGSNSEFTPITTTIPRGSFLDDDFITDLTFSKRGSVMLGGKRVNADGLPASSPMNQSGQKGTPGPATEPATLGGDAAQDATAGAVKTESSKKLSLPNIRVLSLDTERESQKVRSLYESGDFINWQDGAPGPSLGERLSPTEEVPLEDEGVVAKRSVPASGTLLSPILGTPRSTSSLSSQRDSRERKDFELAGGIEDWEDVEGGDVDRYGFIKVRRPESRASTPDTRGSLHTPRKRNGRNVLVKRDPSSFINPQGPLRMPSRKVSARSLYTQASERTTASRRSSRSPIRAAANLLPHNRNRRWMDEAGDMLTMSPGLADIEEEQQIEKISDALKKKEIERSEKWRKMAKVVKRGKDGEGMEFDFDTKSQKLIDRTWKGIPDRWRAAAWYSFMATSAAKAGAKATDEQIIAEFHRLQSNGSPDDVQIDLDVPRTINRHIMFRKRYRGGQRLLFRVLHALSLYFPDTGYVQGMAALATTLLCYYDEERCFVMLVRMWQLRGLERLYQPGFAGLMTALKDFEQEWLGGKEAAKKLTELGIDATAFGTRWYLTLFNLSIPFPAQLRVWDVFMLLGDAPQMRTQPNPELVDEKNAPFPGLEILHATSAALIDALKEVLVDSDFENAMKALTSWVPIKDEELLMKVVRAEWKHHQRKRS